MKKILLMFLLVLCTSSVSFAEPIQMANGTYTVPENHIVVAELNPLAMSHNRYYSWGLEDLDLPLEQMDYVDLVFRGIYDNSREENWLNIFIFNETPDYPIDMGTTTKGMTRLVMIYRSGTSSIRQQLLWMSGSTRTSTATHSFFTTLSSELVTQPFWLS